MCLFPVVFNGQSVFRVHPERLVFSEERSERLEFRKLHFWAEKRPTLFAFFIYSFFYVIN